MKHFIGFLAFIFACLFLALFLRSHRETSRDARPVVRIFGPSSFVSQWGPGPWLKQAFEKNCDCRVEFVDGADASTLFQRLKSEARTGADLVIGLDQFDLEQASSLLEWKTPNVSQFDFDEKAKAGMVKNSFIPYDWGVLAFVLRQSEVSQLPHKFGDLLEAQWKGQIALEDPRTSSPGLQFLNWLIQLKGEDAAFEFLKVFNKQVKSYSVSWSMANGLFEKSQVKAYFSYMTSPIYFQDSNIVAVEFDEGHPVQYEYVGIPAICKNCDLAESFLSLVLSPQGQKIIMEKNYMFPVIKGVKEGTPFANIPPMKILPMSQLPSIADKERILKKWSNLRRME